MSRSPAPREPRNTIVIPPAESARAAGLKHVDDGATGWGRRRVGKSFRYLDQAKRPVRDPEALARIRSLAIPPAWQDVWICPDPDGHLQATGRDERGRKQYRYHPRWRSVRDDTKYGRMIAFGRALGPLRKRVDRDLARPGLPREKVLAAVVRLLETTLIRVGNAEYAKANRSFGLTTMRDKHATIEGGSVRFEFRGKSGVSHAITLEDRRLAKIVKRCRDLPGQELFQHLDEAGARHDIGSADVNDYLREAMGQEFTAKDFRTWAGTVLASLALQEFEAFDSQAQAKKNLIRAVESVAERLGNTPTICRKCYIHPAVIDAYLEGSMIDTLQHRAEEAMAKSLAHLRPEEAAVLALIQQRLARERERDGGARGGRRRKAPSSGRGTG